MATYDELAADLARRIADGSWAPGDLVPSARQLADDRGISSATAGRALRELSHAGIIAGAPRRRARVSSDGAARAWGWLHGTPALRLAGSDDPLLVRLLDVADAPILRLPGTGSVAGLQALWADEADSASLHLRTPDGRYNAPFVASLLADRRPALVHLWRRDQGIAVAAGRASDIGGLGDLVDLRVALRPPGTGTRNLLEQLAREQGIDPATFDGPTLTSHLDVAVAIATGTADAGITVRSAAHLLDLAFLTLTSEPFELAIAADQLPRLDPILASAASDRFRELADRLGYDLTDTGQTRILAS